MTLVQFLAQMKQMEKAEPAVRDAEAALKDKSPLGLARCCERSGQAYKLNGQDAQKAKFWHDATIQWYKVARDAKPNDPAPTHQLVEFLLRSGQLKDVESQLRVILEKNHTKDPKSVDEVAWARHTLALTLLMNDNDYQRSRKALAILEPIEKAHQRTGGYSQPRRPESPRQGLPGSGDKGLPGEGAEDSRGTGRCARGRS